MHKNIPSDEITIDLKRNGVATLIRFSLYFLVFTTIFFAVLQILIRTEFKVLKENNLVEWIEFLLLIISALFLFLASRRTQEFPILYTILPLFPVVAAIRELDAVFDRIFHGAWVIPVTVVYMIILYKIVKWSHPLKDEVLRFVQTQQIVFFGIGFLVVVIVAQLSGQKIVWRAVLGNNYQRIAKALVEELIEFVGYLILVVGSIECWISARINQPVARE